MKVYLAYTPSDDGGNEVRKVFADHAKALSYLDIYFAGLYGEKWCEISLKERVEDLRLQIEEHEVDE